MLLLRAAPQWHGETEFSVEHKGRQVPVTVAPCATVLAVLDALAADRPDGQHLVVLTPCDAREVGDSVLAQAMQPEIKPVDRWDLVKDAFGALRLDPALTKKDNRWVAEALLDAQPAGGWRRLSGTVLSRATALNRLAATRLGIEDADESRWTPPPCSSGPRTAPPSRPFSAFARTNGAGSSPWLAETTGGVADVVFAMAATGKISDAVPFGLAAAALYGPPVHAQAARMEPASGTDECGRRPRPCGGTLPRRHNPLTPMRCRAFGEAAESLVTRWADNGHAARAAALCERAEDDPRRTGRHRGRQAGPGQPLARSRSRPGRPVHRPWPTRSATALSALEPTTLTAAEKALDGVRAHGRKRDRDGEIRAAADAVRLTRWLATPEPSSATLAEAATRMLRSWAWADRALASIARADTSRVPRLAQVYATLWDRARGRRAQLDADFARQLAAWTEASSSSDDLLLVENLLDRIARPVAEQRLPVIVVLDGMTAAVGTSSPRSSPAAAAGLRSAATRTAVNPCSPPSLRSPPSPGRAC